MTRVKSTFFRVLIFLLGLGVIFLAFVLLNPDYVDGLTDEQMYLWVSILLMYSLLFCPFVFSSLRPDNIDKNVPVLVYVWPSIFLLILATIGLLAAVMYDKLLLTHAIIVQAVLLFGFAIVLYFAYFAGGHIVSVGQKEAASLSLIKDIRSSLGFIDLKAGGLGDEYADIKKQIKSAAETVRYISPVDTALAIDLERKIQNSIKEVDFSLDSMVNGSGAGSLKAQVAALLNVIAQRKMLKK